MKNSDPRKKKLQLSLRETKSLFRRTRSTTIRRECSKVLKISKACLKISRSYSKELFSLRENNVDLARAVQKEKENYSFLLQEKNAADSCFQDLQRENACLKKDLQKLEKIIINYDEDLKNSMIPNLVKLSDDITQFKFKNDIIKKVIESRGNGDVGLPKNSWANGNSWSNGVNFTSNSNQPVSTVNPMVKGCIIQKPTINVRRVSIPNENRPSLFANMDIASPILEEPENELETVTSRNRKCKNGLRHVINLSNAPVTSIPSVAVSEIGFRSKSDEFSDETDFRMEPVVRLSDVARLLQNSSYRISEPTSGSPTLQKRYSSPHGNFTPEVVLKRCKTPKTSSNENESEDNPLEGCSWMYRNSPSPQFERTSSRVSPVAQPHDQSWTKTQHKDSNQDKSNRNSTKKDNSPAELNQYIEKHESLFRAPSLPNSDFIIKRKESCYPRASTATLNDSSAPVKETTFLSSTLNSAKKKKFFAEVDESSVFFTTRRRLPRSSESIANLLPSNSEESYLMKSTENIESGCSNNLKTIVEVSTSNIQTEQSLKKSSQRKNKKRSVRKTKNKEIEPRNASNIENFSPIENSVRRKSMRTRTVLVELEDCMPSTKKLPAKKKLSVRKTKSISYDSDSSYSAVSSSQSSESPDDGSSRRSCRRKRTVSSYKEPHLGKKLRR